MSLKDRLLSYVPFFHHYEFDEIIECFENETIIRVKKDDYDQSYAYIRVVSLFCQDHSIEELEDYIEQVKLLMAVSDERYLDYEQYLIEDEAHQIIGLDLCMLLDDSEYESLRLEDIKDDELYQVGLYYYDMKNYERAIECFSLGEDINDSDCICILGYMHEKGYGFDPDNEIAAQYYAMASDLGNVVASCNLAYFYEFGIGVQQDYKKAYELYRLGEKENFPRSLFSIGYCLQHGLGTEKNMEQALEYFKKAAQYGYVDAHCSLGECYEFGEGVEQDYHESFLHYQKAAESDNTVALYKLGRFYDMGLGVEQDKEKAFYYYQKAARKKLEIAIVALATCYEFGNGTNQDSDKALHYYTQAAEMNYTHGQYCLGYFYEIHKEIEDHYQRSLYWYQRASDNNDTQAMLSVAYFYEMGLGVEQDFAKAFMYYQKAAKLHDRHALYCLGVCYMEGRGVLPDREKGFRYLNELATSYSLSAYYLGMYFRYELHRDEQAVVYFKQAVTIDNDLRSLYQLVLYGEEGRLISPQEMLTYLHQAVEGDYIPAIVKYALFLEKGIYVTKDYEKAYQYILYAAKRKSAEGCYHLGRWHFYGIDGHDNKELALYCFQLASQDHFPEASFMLGYIYHYGDGVKQDLNLAKKYYLKAIDDGSKEAQNELNKLEVEK